MYKTAIIEGLRFDTSNLPRGYTSARGLLSCEDVVTLNLNSIDLIAQSVNRALKADEDQESFIKTTRPTKVTRLNRLRLEILKDIIQDKQAAELKAEKAKILRAEKENLEAALAAKKGDAIKELSVEELQARIAELNS